MYVRRDSLIRFSPDSLSLMEFQTQRDYEVTERIYAGSPLLSETLGRADRRLNVPHMTNDRHLFNTRSGVIAVYNGRMLHQFDAHYAPHEFWIAEGKAIDVPSATMQQIQHYRLGYRRIARPTDVRTLIAAVVPPSTICDTVAIIEGDAERQNRCVLYLSGLFNSLCLDYVLRLKIATTVNMFYVYQLPLPRLNPGNPYFDAIVPRAARLTCTRPEFAGLWQQVMGEPWDQSKAAADPAARQALRDELDALVAHLYGLSRDDFAHILGTFPLVFPDNDDGRRKKKALLGVYDGLAARVQSWARE